MEKTNNVSCKKWGQFGGPIVQTFLQFSVSQSVTSFSSLPVMRGLHILCQLSVFLISGKGSAMGVHASAQLPLTKSSEATWQVSAIWAAGNGSPL